MIAPETIFGVLFWAAVGWYGYSKYVENNPSVDLAGPRSDACEAMTQIGALDEQGGAQCLTDDAVYLSGLRDALETRADRFQKNMNEIVAEVSETASRLDDSVFTSMQARHAFDNQERFPIDDEANSDLKRVQVDVSNITISAPFEEDPDGLPTMQIRLDGIAEDDVVYGFDLNDLVFEVMEYPFVFGCDDIVGMDGGCRGTVFVDLRSDGIMGATPVIVGFDMAPLTERQAIEIAFGLSAPQFSDTSEEYDAARMKEVAELI
ncbi:MAG: hypothetical protein RIA08_06200 [Roseovarius sp.]|uniref:hypothetical protein n=1 Tax=Bacteria TaxID=2 RepID=UPI0032EB0737